MIKQLFLFLLLSIISISGYTQFYEWGQYVEYNSTIMQISTADKFGNSFLAGTLFTPTTVGSQTYTSIGDVDIMLQKYNATGGLEWVRLLGGVNTDLADDITTDNAGNVYVSGNFQFSMTIGSTTLTVPATSNTTHSGFVAKFDPMGNLLWTFQAEDPTTTFGSASMNAITCDQNDNLIVAGTFAGIVSFGTNTYVTDSIYGTNSRGGFLAKFDPNGNLLWSKPNYSSGGSNGGGFPHAVAVDQNNNLVVVGTWQHHLNLGSVNWGDSTAFGITDVSYYRLRYDANGNLTSHIYSPPSPKVNINSFPEMELAITPDGNIYHTGFFNDTLIIGTDSLVAVSSGNGFLVKFDPSGNVDWLQKTGNDNVEVWDITARSNNEILLTGQFDGTITMGSFCQSSITLKGFVASIDTAGNYNWMINGFNAASGHNGFIEVQEDTAADLYLTGFYYTDSLYLPPFTLPFQTANSNVNLFLAKMGDPANVISGMMYVDKNNNGVKDTNEFTVPNLLVNTTVGSNSAMTFGVDQYRIFADSGSHQVQPGNPPPYYSVLPASHQANFGGLFGQVDSLNDFRLVPNLAVQDLEVTTIAPFSVRLFDPHHFTIQYSNPGSTTMSGTVTFAPDSLLHFISSQPPPDSLLGDTAKWNFSSLECLQTEQIKMVIKLDTNATLGDTLISHTWITPFLGDSTVNNNTDTSYGVATIGYDPNIKEVIPAGPLTRNVAISGNPLTYTIHFQNTGTATTGRVIIRDTLDSNLQLNTIRMIAASHSYRFDMRDGNHATWTFDNIQLPDSATDEPGSHGFVRYEIVPNTNLWGGDVITNRAGIYFDFNDVVITNTAVTDITGPGNPIGIIEETPDIEVKVFPNPNRGNFTLQIQKQQAGTLEWSLYNLLGQPIQSAKMELAKGMHHLPIEANNQAEGIYFLRVATEEKSAVTKVVIKN